MWKRPSTKARSSSTWKISPRGMPEQAPEEVEVDRPLVVGGRHQHGLVGDQRQAERRREVEVRVEEEAVVVVGVGSDPLDQERRERSLPPHPLGLVEERVRGGVEPVRVAPERAHAARAVHGEPAHADPVDRLHARRVDVPPGEVVARAGGQHLDVVVGRERLRHAAALVLGPPVDLGAVALHDERQPEPRHVRSRPRAHRAAAPGPMPERQPSRRLRPAGAPRPVRNRHRSASALARVSRCSRSVAPIVSASNARSRARWPGDDGGAHRGVANDPVEQLGDRREVLLLDQEPGVAHGARHAGGGVRDHRHVEVHGLEERHAEALVLGEAQVRRGEAVVRAELGLRDGAREHHVVEKAELRAELLTAREVGLGVHRRPDDDQPALRVEAPVEVIRLDQVLHALVRGEAAHEEEGRPARVRLLERAHRGMGVLVPVDQDRQHPGPREPRRRELLPVELRDPEGELGHVPEPRELPASAPAAVGHARVDPDEVLRRRDVVVDDGAPVPQAREEAGDLRPDREVEEDHRVGGGHRPVRRVEVGVLQEAHVAVLRVHLGRIAPAPEEAAERPHVVADGISHVEVRHELVDGPDGRARHESRAPTPRRTAR